MAKCWMAAFVAAMAWCGSAGATVYTLSSTGTIRNGLDFTGLFGQAGANLAGKGYRLDMAFDSAAFDRSILNADVSFGVTTNPVGMRITATVNGASYVTATT